METLLSRYHGGSLMVEGVPKSRCIITISPFFADRK